MAPNFFGPASGNEDCLCLNVYTPQQIQPLPVIVWIHGGDFITGQGADYDGSALVQAGNLVVVTLNYRLPCMGFIIERALAKQVDTYVYEFSDENAPQVYLPPIDSFAYGATHCSELPYLFPQVQGYDYGLGKAVLDADQQHLADMMKAYWTQFARTGNPNRGGLPNWTPYVPGSDTFLSLAPPMPEMSTGFAAEHKCFFWTPLLQMSAVLPSWLTGAVQ